MFVFNPLANRVLPGTIRPYSSIWDESLLNYRDIPNIAGVGYVTPTPEKSGILRIGRYFATAQVTFKDANGKLQLLNMTREFWIIPWKLILLLIAIIAIVIYLISRKRKSKKDTNRNEKSKWMVN